MADNLGKRLVLSLLVEKNPTVLIQAGIDRTSIFDDARTAFDWVSKYHTEESEWPNAKMVEECTGVSLPDETDKLEYICDLIRKRGLATRIEKGLRKAAEELEKREPDEALESVRKLGIEVKIRGDISSYRKGGDSRYALYKKAKEVGGLVGIPTPWVQLNSTIQGWVDGTLNVVTALQNTGKTWWACIVAEYCLSLGANVLFVTLEMGIPRIEKRLDAVHHRIPWKSLRNAELDGADEKMYEDLLNWFISK